MASLAAKFVLLALHGAWLVAIGVVRALYRLGWWIGYAPALRPLFAHDTVCPWCRARVALTGAWRCGSCGSGELGHGLARCGVCGRRPLRIDCPSCGLALKHPLGEVEP